MGRAEALVLALALAGSAVATPDYQDLGVSGVYGQDAGVPIVTEPVAATSSRGAGSVPAGVARDQFRARADVRTFTQNGKRYVVVDPDDTFESIAQEVYGDASYWYLIYYYNREFLADQDRGADEAILYLPPAVLASPLAAPTGVEGGSGAGTGTGALPVDLSGGQRASTFRPLSAAAPPPSAVSSGAWTFSGGSSGGYVGAQRGDAYGRVSSGPLPGYDTRFRGTSGGGGDFRPAPSNVARVPGADARGAPLPQGMAGLNLSGPGQIGEREAATILEAAGFMTDKIHDYFRREANPKPANKLQSAMMAISWGNRFREPSGPVPLDAQMKQWLFQEYQQLREAQQRYQGWPDISAEARPQQYDAWVRDAAQHLTALPADQRIPVMLGLMGQESGRTHWRGYRPITSYAGEVGFGQFLPGTARSLGINRYDPAQNIAGIAKLLNQNLERQRRNGNSGRAALRTALAQYNGGNSPPARSFTYADDVLRRAGSVA